MDELNAEEFEVAKARGNARLRGPRAVTARYDAGRNRVIVRLTTASKSPSRHVMSKACSTPRPRTSNRSRWKHSVLGFIPTLDTDLYVPALLKGILGSKRWMAARLATTTGGIHDASQPGSMRENGNRRRRRRKSVTW